MGSADIIFVQVETGKSLQKMRANTSDLQDTSADKHWIFTTSTVTNNLR